MAERMREEDFGDLSKLMEAVDRDGIVFVTRGGRKIEDDLVAMTVGEFTKLMVPDPKTESLVTKALSASDRGG
jgi:hypothetical protein